jgi:hypothetical protein
MTTSSAVLSSLAAVIACAACHAPQAAARTPSTPAPAPAASADDEHKDFNGALSVVERRLGTKATPLTLSNGERVAGSWMLKTADGLSKIADLQQQLLGYGAYLVLVEPGLDEPDVLGLLPTTDKYEVVRMMRTDGNLAHTHEEIVAWLQALDRAEPWLLVGASFDFVDGLFVEPVRDPHAVAQNVLAFCPDFFYQGIGLDPAKQGQIPLVATEEYFKRERHFHFWWD